VEIDGAVLQVCDRCARLGKRVTSQPSRVKTYLPRPSLRFDDVMSENLVIREDFHVIIKRTREMLGLTQEELGRKLGEKTSLISKLETGKLRPSIPLARKIEHVLKVKIIEEESG
jgi:putative transcription factor